MPLGKRCEIERRVIGHPTSKTNRFDEQAPRIKKEPPALAKLDGSKALGRQVEPETAGPQRIPARIIGWFRSVISRRAGFKIPELVSFHTCDVQLRKSNASH